jgi:hypothetical protein
MGEVCHPFDEGGTSPDLRTPCGRGLTQLSPGAGLGGDCLWDIALLRAPPTTFSLSGVDPSAASRRRCVVPLRRHRARPDAIGLDPEAPAAPEYLRLVIETYESERRSKRRSLAPRCTMSVTSLRNFTPSPRPARGGKRPVRAGRVPSNKRPFSVHGGAGYAGWAARCQPKLAEGPWGALVAPLLLGRA